MTWVRRVVFDTSTLVSAGIRPGSTPHQALQQALAWSDICASAQTWLELEAVMPRDRFDRCITRQARLDYLVMLRRALHFFAVTPDDEAALTSLCRDPTDNKFLALARVCEADALVSSDADLLVLHPWHELTIVTPTAFLARVGGHT